jgi:hypothetical protein
MTGGSPTQVTHFTCFTGTTVQILTQLPGAPRTPVLRLLPYPLAEAGAEGGGTAAGTHARTHTHTQYSQVAVWAVGQGEAVVLVFRSGLRAVAAVAAVELWGSWLSCLVNVSYLPDLEIGGGEAAGRPTNLTHIGSSSGFLGGGAGEGGAGRADGEYLVVTGQTWLPLTVSTEDTGGGGGGGGVEVEGVVRGMVVLRVVEVIRGIRAIRVQPVALLQRERGSEGARERGSEGGNVMREGGSCSMSLEEIAVLTP